MDESQKERDLKVKAEPMVESNTTVKLGNFSNPVYFYFMLEPLF